MTWQAGGVIAQLTASVQGSIATIKGHNQDRTAHPLAVLEQGPANCSDMHAIYSAADLVSVLCSL